MHKITGQGQGHNL